MLKELLAQAEAGEITGFAFACKLGLQHHGIGITDDYRRELDQVIDVTERINRRVRKLKADRERRAAA